MPRTIARLIWYLKRCKTILVIFLKNLGIISQTNSSSLSARQALAVTKLCCRKPPTRQSKQNLSAGRSELFIGGYQASAEYYQNKRTTDEKSYSWLWWICRVIFTTCYVCTKFVKHTYIKICYILGNLLNRHFAYHFMYLNNAETTCLQIRNEIIKIKTDDPTTSHGNYEVKLRPAYALHGKTSENAVSWQTQTDYY